MKYLKKSLSCMVLAGLLFSTTAFAKDDLSLMERSYLTGDWGGTRTKLKENGIDIELEYTSTYQGLASGDGASNDKYGGKADLLINFDTQKLGLWDGGGIHSHFEYRHANNNVLYGGSVFAQNSACFMPQDVYEKVEMTSLYFSQKIGDDNMLLFGKINAIDLLASDSFFGGWGTHRFMNLALVAQPSGLISSVIMGTVLNINTKPLSWTFMLFDPNNRTSDYLPDDLFSDGVTMSLSGNYASTLFERKTNYKITALYSTKEGTDLSQLSPNFETTTKKGSYNIGFQFSHILEETSEGNWGVYLKAAVADGNPNAIQSSLLGGVGGKALFFNRPEDSFGIGFYYYDFSDVLQDTLYPQIKFHDEVGMEAFYSYALTPWFHITGDIQYINPADGEKKNALVLGLRTNIRF